MELTIIEALHLLASKIPWHAESEYLAVRDAFTEHFTPIDHEPAKEDTPNE